MYGWVSNVWGFDPSNIVGVGLSAGSFYFWTHICAQSTDPGMLPTPLLPPPPCTPRPVAPLHAPSLPSPLQA